MERARPSRLPLKSGRNVRVDRSRPRREEKRAPRPAARRSEDAPPKERTREKPHRHGPRREILAVGCLALGLVLVLALLTHDAAGGANLIGPAGRWVARGLFAFLGLSAFLVPTALLAGFVALVRPTAARPGAIAVASFAAIVLCGAMLLDLVAPAWTPFGERPGGWLGGVLADGMVRLFGSVGAGILVSAALAAALILAIGLPFSRIALFCGAVAKRLSLAVAAFVQKQVEQHRAEREAMLADLAAEDDEDTSEEDAIAEAAMAASAEAEAELEPVDEEKPKKKGRKKKDEAMLEADPDGRVLPLPILEEHKPTVVLPPESAAREAPPVELPPETDAAGSPIPPDPAWAIGEPIAPKLPSKKRKAAAVAEVSTATDVAGFAADAPAEPPVPAAPAETPDVSALPPAAVQALQKAGKLPVPTIELPKAPPKPKKDADAAFDLIKTEDGFSLPPMSLLDGRDEAHQVVIDEDLLHATAEKLRQKLADFGIQGHVERIRPGPVVTMYEFAPAAGVKISKIASLSDDLAMALEALRVRIVAPIPGRGVVGIEVPNRTRQIVYLKEIVEQDVFRKSSSKLTMAIGKDIEGMPFVADLGKMPHLLMAGTTGSGKSVSVNSMIMSLLFKATPEEVRFIMVDPKMLELSIYEGIPHLLLPVVTDPKKAALALRWAVDEMERRYALLAESGVRDLPSFNKLVAERQAEAAARAARGEEAPAPAAAPKPSKLLIIDVEAGETEERAVERMEAATDAAPAAPAPVEEKPAPKKLPYVVIIIDELADLMMVASKEVETYIARIAQKARAAGIHLMVATQRPSVDVITGLIKANFPSRISFLLRSRVDSQTILDTQGAEKLLGQGDMLILPPTSSHIQRVHGALVTEREIKRVVDHLKAQGKPIYDESILQAPEEDVEGGGEEDELSDELYDQAIAIVSEMRTVSISMLQRKMRIGYNRSARMIERMERDGIVGPADGAKPREVLIRGLGEMSERQG
jgi:S-DNA-T family DNA segregation ATPase FtsK/SpoIIIE